ncbi:MAG TPA: DMT family transporter [Gemmatimonadaceae bacterium]
MTPGHDRAAATLSLVGAAFGFSTIAIFTVLLDRAGTPLLSAMLGRYVVASLVLIPVAGGIAALRLPRRRIAQLAGIGGLGQSLIAFLSLSALEFIPAAMLVFLFYTFPAWVALRAAILKAEVLTGARLFALFLSFAGVGVMVGWPGTAAVHPLGAGLALSAAVVYALFIPLIDRLRTGVSAVVATSWVAIGATLIFLVAAVVMRQLTMPTAPMAWIHIIGLGTLSTAVAFTLFLRGLQAVGPVMAAIVTTTEPFFVAILAALVLDQPIQPQTVAGGSLIAIAVLTLQRTPPVSQVPQQP